MLTPPEAFVKQTLLRHPDAKRIEKELRDARDAGDPELRSPAWPDWCSLPMGAAYAMLTPGKIERKAAADYLLENDGILEVSNLTAALIWDRSRVIYRFDRTLAEELIGQPLDGKLPEQVLFHMPYPCVYIETFFEINGQPAVGFFAWLEHDEQQNCDELRLLYLLKSGFAVAEPVIMSGGTLSDSAEALKLSAIKNLEEGLPADADDAKLYNADGSVTAAAINLLLYICSDDPDYDGLKPPELVKKRSKTSSGLPKRVAIHDLGARIGSAIRSAQC